MEKRLACMAVHEKHYTASRRAAWRELVRCARGRSACRTRTQYAPSVQVCGYLYNRHIRDPKSVFKFNIMPLSHPVWVYRSETQRYYYFIPAGKTVQAVLIFYEGDVSLQGNLDRVNELLLYASSRAPGAVSGHTAELSTLWRKDTTAFVAGVEERRRQTRSRAIRHQWEGRRFLKLSPDQYAKLKEG
jgi:hypothetical protein